MTTEIIVFLERNTFNVPFRKPAFDHEWSEFGETAAGEVVERLAPATIAICNKLPLRAETLSQLPQLKLIAVAATGVDNVDLAYCRSHNIAVCNTRGYAVNSLPEHALMLMLALRRNLIAYRNDVKAGRWHEAKQFCLLDHPIGDLRGATLGIVGFGTLGKSMAQVGRAIGMEVLVAVRDDRAGFEEVLRRSDVLSLHCPLTEETKNLIGAAELAQMKPDAILINTARGGLIDEAALIAALDAGKIFGAGFDVVESETEVTPLRTALVHHPKIIVTAHTAWLSQQARALLQLRAIEQALARLRGEIPYGLINRELAK